MIYEDSYEFFKFVETLADNYIPLSTLLKNAGLTFEQGISRINEFRTKIFSLMKKYKIKTENVLSAGLDMCEIIEKCSINDEIIHMYTSFVTDCGLLFDLHPDSRTDEQDLYCWFEQQDKANELAEFIRRHFDFSEKLKKFSASGYTLHSNENVQTEQALLFGISLKEKFLSGGKESSVYLENIGELVRIVNAYDELSGIKPYVYFAVLSGKHKMMLERPGYIPNISSVFTRKNYRIDCDNGKNFKNYDEYIDLYCRIREYFIADPSADIDFSDFCFSALSNLSEWYYYGRKDTSEFYVPMGIAEKIRSVMPGPFPDIADRVYYSDYYAEFTKKNPVLAIAYRNVIRKNPDIVNEFTEAYYEGKSTVAAAGNLFNAANAVSICDDTGMAMAYAGYYLGVASEVCLRDELCEVWRTII